MIGDLAALGEHRRDEQIFGPRVGRALIDVKVLPAQLRAGHTERRLADARRADEPRRERIVAGVDRDPTRDELPQNFALPNPLRLVGVGLRKFEADVVNVDVAGIEIVVFLWHGTGGWARSSVTGRAKTISVAGFPAGRNHLGHRRGTFRLGHRRHLRFDLENRETG